MPFWRQRFDRVTDPDGNEMSLFAYAGLTEHESGSIFMSLITTPTGNPGRAILARIDALGAHYRVLVRDACKLTPHRGQVVTADLCNPQALRQARRGVNAANLVHHARPIALWRALIEAFTSQSAKRPLATSKFEFEATLLDPVMRGT